MKLFVILLFLVFALPAFAQDSGTKIMNEGINAGYEYVKNSDSYVSVENGEIFCKQSACEHGYCESQGQCNYLKYDIFMSGCMYSIKFTR